MGNRSLSNARRVRNDEFYTQYETIEDELKNYKRHFEDKVVYCNCDDPRWSNFFKYFVDNFHELKLKRLIASGYVDQSYNLFTIDEEREPAVWVNYDGWLIDGRVPNISEIKMMELNGDGDFRSEESIELLEQADIIVTNPPFSLFKEYAAQLMEHNKKFLIIGSSNVITYKGLFPLIKDSKMWPGVSRGAMTFEIPDNTSSIEHIIDKVHRREEQSLGNVTWWTNLEHPHRHQDAVLLRYYKSNEYKYPRYDNYDAINVDKVADIPKDYNGVLGVPISFVFSWNPEQFEIVGITKSYDNNKYKSYPGIDAPIVNGEPLYARILIQNKLLNPEIYGGK